MGNILMFIRVYFQIHLDTHTHIHTNNNSNNNNTNDNNNLHAKFSTIMELPKASNTAKHNTMCPSVNSTISTYQMLTKKSGE